VMLRCVCFFVFILQLWWSQITPQRVSRCEAASQRTTPSRVAHHRYRVCALFYGIGLRENPGNPPMVSTW
jgi:hypothetical protein